MTKKKISIKDYIKIKRQDVNMEGANPVDSKGLLEETPSAVSHLSLRVKLGCQCFLVMLSWFLYDK